MPQGGAVGFWALWFFCETAAALGFYLHYSNTSSRAIVQLILLPGHLYTLLTRPEQFCSKFSFSDQFRYLFWVRFWATTTSCLLPVPNMQHSTTPKSFLRYKETLLRGPSEFWLLLLNPSYHREIAEYTLVPGHWRFHTC